MRPLLVLLPGLDGSGELFAPLLAALGDAVDCHVLRLPTDGPQSQAVLAQRLLPQLPQQPFVLLAESFSGAIAVEITRLHPPGLQQLILVATFLQAPRPVLLRMPRICFWLGWQLHRPLVSLWWPFCGKRSDITTRNLVLKALGTLSWEVLHARLRTIQNLDLQVDTLRCPVSIFHAEDDCLVPAMIRERLNRLGRHALIPGPHFLLQSEPTVMAKRIAQLLQFTSPETD